MAENIQRNTKGADQGITRNATILQENTEEMTKTKGIGQAGKLGYPTINLVLSKDLLCGFYECKSVWGNCVLIVDKTQRFGECHIKNFEQKIDEYNSFYLYDLKKIESNIGIIGMYNNACKC